MGAIQRAARAVHAANTSLSQHMAKEAAQVQPLLQQHFTEHEQSSLVWQFLASIPVVRAAPMLSWALGHLPLKERKGMSGQLCAAAPGEGERRLIASWLASDARSDASSESLNGVGAGDAAAAAAAATAAAAAEDGSSTLSDSDGAGASVPLGKAVQVEHIRLTLG